MDNLGLLPGLESVISIIKNASPKEVFGFMKSTIERGKILFFYIIKSFGGAIGDISDNDLLKLNEYILKLKPNLFWVN